MRFFFQISYKGGRYHGWQKHPGVISVQEIIESALSLILKVGVEIVGCGRTDAGVHASQFYFHCDLEQNWDFDLGFRINKTLPNDISLLSYFPVSNTAHARFDADQRTYQYYIHTYKDPFLTGLSAYYEVKNLNYLVIDQAMLLLLKYNDYAAYCKSPKNYEHTRCYISKSQCLVSADEKKILIEISSNRFLAGMIRILVNKFLDLGTGQWSLDEFEYHLSSCITPALIKPAYPEGLYLTKVNYPFLNIL